MGVQLERERPGTDHVQVSGAVRRPQEVAYRQRGIVPVQEHVPVCKYQYHYYYIDTQLYWRHWFFVQVNVGSLENVIRGYLRSAEERTEAAREQSQQAVVDIDDLDNLATPESILLR